MTRRATWVGAISLVNATAAGVVASWVVRDAAGAGWDALVPCGIVAALGLSVVGVWWGTRRRPRVRTGVGIGLAVGVLVHPAMWYLALLVAFVTGARTSLGEPTLTPLEALSAVWVYAAFGLLFTGWLSCPLSAGICGVGLTLYARRSNPA